MTSVSQMSLAPPLRQLFRATGLHEVWPIQLPVTLHGHYQPEKGGRRGSALPKNICSGLLPGVQPCQSFASMARGSQPWTWCFISQVHVNNSEVRHTWPKHFVGTQPIQNGWPNHMASFLHQKENNGKPLNSESHFTLSHLGVKSSRPTLIGPSIQPIQHPWASTNTSGFSSNSSMVALPLPSHSTH